MRHRRLHQVVFVTAGLYNVAWGLYAAADPQWLFRFAGMPPINYPEIFACLGMVVGLYGVVYSKSRDDRNTGYCLPPSA